MVAESTSWTDGDIDKAVGWLREKESWRHKKEESGRIAAEGLVRYFGEGNKFATIAELTQGLGFRIKEQKSSLNLLETIAAEAPVRVTLDMDVFLEEPFQGSTVKEKFWQQRFESGRTLTSEDTLELKMVLFIPKLHPRWRQNRCCYRNQNWCYTCRGKLQLETLPYD